MKNFYAKYKREILVLVATLILGVIFTVLNSNFLTYRNILTVFQQMVLNGLLAVGIMFTILTGGIAYNKITVDALTDRVGWIAPITVYPGEDELLALAQGAIRVMTGEEKVMQY